MHCVMLTSEAQNPHAKTGLDFTKEMIRGIEDPKFFRAILEKVMHLLVDLCQISVARGCYTLRARVKRILLQVL